jgi:hypothetical protein
MYKLWLKSADAQLAYTYSQTAGGLQMSQNLAENGWRQAEEPNNATYLLYYNSTTYIYL